MLINAGCTLFYGDYELPKKNLLPGLTDALNKLKPGDYLLVPSLENVASSLNQLVLLVENIKARQAYLISLFEDIDTSKNDQQFFDKLSTFQTRSLQLRTSRGLSAARARGLKGGRPGLSIEKINALNKLYDDKKSISEICNALNITRSTLYKYIKKENLEKEQA